MLHQDRLSSLVSHFEVRVQSRTGDAQPNLVIAGEEGVPTVLWLGFGKDIRPAGLPEVMSSARLDFGGQANPVLDALPEEIRIDLVDAQELRAIASLISSEMNTPRCGGQFALDRLCELMLVAVLRREIELGRPDTGVLSGLANSNLSPVLVAIHDHPGRQWRLDDFVALSGMSRSLFMSAFTSVLGQSPMAYLKNWRMTLARNALMNGDRVKETARRFGYGSGDAFTRAFSATYGIPPTQLDRVNRGIPPS